MRVVFFHARIGSPDANCGFFTAKPSTAMCTAPHPPSTTLSTDAEPMRKCTETAVQCAV